jgi:hypothetical protein
VPDGYPRPDHGVDYVDRVCATCGASWVGHPDAGCWWCEAAVARLRVAQRAVLLDPPWLATSAGHPRYDALDEAGKAVWDRTRGQSRGVDAVTTWIGRLERGVAAGLIGEQEARRAIRRVTR